MRVRRTYIVVLIVIVSLFGILNKQPLSYPRYDEPIKIMPLGDSITLGVGSSGYTGYRKPLYLKLIDDGYSVDFVGSQENGDEFYDGDHSGFGGYKTSDINIPNTGIREGKEPYQLNSWLNKFSPDIILYHIGTNDLSPPQSDPEKAADGANLTLSIIFSSDPDITVILAKIILPDGRENFKNRVREYNALLESRARFWANLGYSIVVADMENNLESTDYYDTRHPNEQGYLKMAEIWYHAIVYSLSVDEIKENLLMMVNGNGADILKNIWLPKLK